MALTKRTAGLPLICLVCGDVARGINFDLMTCMSCKAFFRRHGGKPSHLLRCQLDGNCVIDQRTRGACSACRLQKCLRLGMNATLIRHPAQTTKKPSRPRDLPMSENRLPQPKPLSLLQQDRSTLTSDEWTLLSNIIHAYDASNIIPQTKTLLQQQVSLPPKLRSKPSTTFQVIKYFYSFIQPLLKRSPFFLQLPNDVRRSLIRNNTETLGSFNTTLILREIDALGNPAFFSGCSTIYGSDATNNGTRFLSRMESDGNLVKIMLFICVFSGNCSTVRFRGLESASELSNSLVLSHIQNLLVTVFWKYLTYQYGLTNAVRCFSSLVKFLIDLVKSVDRLSTAEHLKMIDIIIEESTRLLINEDDTPVH